MKDVGIMVCGRVKTICTMGGCIRAVKNRTGAFAVYEEELFLSSAIMCSYCEEEKNNFRDLIERTKKSGANTVHFGVCVRSCKEGKLEELKEILGKEGMKVVIGTH